MAFGAMELFRVLIHQKGQSFLKPLSWTKIRVETKADKKGYMVVCIVASVILPG